MEKLSSILTGWAIRKAAQYKQDQLKMTIEEAISSDLYISRDKTIAFLTQYAIKELNNVPTI